MYRVDQAVIEQWITWLRSATACARSVALAVLLCSSAGCALLPPGVDFPRSTSTALEHPEQTALGQRFAADAGKHDGGSAFRVLSSGIDGFLARAELINAAERTIDVQYYIFRQDTTGQLLTESLLRAADRGVRVRILIDDGETVAGDEQIVALSIHPNIEIRVFNPFLYRGHAEFIRAAEFALSASRLDYRMHNKLFVVDNIIALVGGRNIGDQYFQIDPESQFGDDDLLAAGPVVPKLSDTFDEFWNSRLATPFAALVAGAPAAMALDEYRVTLRAHVSAVQSGGADLVQRMASNEPLASILSGQLRLVWAQSTVVYDSPEKKRVERGEMIGKLMHRSVAATAAATRAELEIVTPFFIPGSAGMQMFQELRDKGVRVRILTNSLESTPELPAHAGYMKYRLPLLEQGVELHEVRALLGSAKGSGEAMALLRFGNYALHAKLFVFDRRSLYIGSMNFDQRSRTLNTEVGLIIESPELAQQIAARFESITAPLNSYALTLAEDGRGVQELVWRTQENGKSVDHDVEPSRSEWDGLKVRLLSLLPLDREL
jgi:putative cardiolipin synthase